MLQDLVCKIGKTLPQRNYIYFFAIVMLMSRVKKLRIAEYWPRDPLIATPQFTDCSPGTDFFY
jgi:hypothetical protein